MPHTEAQAKELRCCGPTGCGYKPPAAGTSAANDRFCCGARCMAWLWDDAQQNSYEKNRPDGEDWEKCGNFWTRTPKDGKPWRVGNCGLTK